MVAHDASMTKTTIYLPKELHKRLQSRAQSKGRSKASLIRDALTKYLADERVELPSFVGSYKGPAPADGYDSNNIKEWIRETYPAHLERKLARSGDPEAD
ncbi:MAG: CopG family transcriptional regulator [Dehalococcoidia bacterium]